ncbi:MAG TPA: hypothetical protein EYO33_21725 [Phycisphaerales bacterium]|nr:hypothetical protein [Phycisphaerales bacterium]
MPTPSFPVTVVSALLDIERNFIPQPYARSIEEYLEWIGFLLSFPCPVVVFTSPELAGRVKSLRGSKPLEIREITANGLRQTNLHDRIAALISGDTKFVNPDRPECYLPLYNGITFRKTEWLRQVAKSNPFQSEYFLWMDAGYGYGRFKGSKAEGRWPVRLNPLADDRVHLLQVNPHPGLDEAQRFRQHKVVFSTACFGGKASAVERLGHAYSLVLNRTLEEALIDDDQAVMTSVYEQDPELFTVVGPTYGRHFEMVRYFTDGKVSKSPAGWVNEHRWQSAVCAVGLAGLGYLASRKLRSVQSEEGESEG